MLGQWWGEERKGPTKVQQEEHTSVKEEEITIIQRPRRQDSPELDQQERRI